MKRLSFVAIALSLLVAGCSKDSTTPTTPTPPANPVFTAALSPANEVPPVTNAESNVSGTANVTLVTTKDASGNITSATATLAFSLGGFPAGSTVTLMHIHEGPTTCVCPVVVNPQLAAGEVTISNGLAAFSRANVPVAPELAQRIISNPSGFYFNVHTSMNPSGVARGVLVKTQ